MLQRSSRRPTATDHLAKKSEPGVGHDMGHYHFWALGFAFDFLAAWSLSCKLLLSDCVNDGGGPFDPEDALPPAGLAPLSTRSVPGSAPLVLRFCGVLGVVFVFFLKSETSHSSFSRLGNTIPASVNWLTKSTIWVLRPLMVT